MMTLKISTGNAAFDNPGQECARILRELADRIGQGLEGPTEDSGPLMDINGNKVVPFKLTTKR